MRLTITALTAALLPGLATATSFADATNPAGGNIPEQVRERFDRDGDGELSPREQRALRRAIRRRRQQSQGSQQSQGTGPQSSNLPMGNADFRTQLMSQFDANGDGQLDTAERTAAQEQRRQNRADVRTSRRQFRQTMIDQFDTDGNGRLTGGERQAARTECSGDQNSPFRSRQQAQRGTDGGQTFGQRGGSSGNRSFTNQGFQGSGGQRGFGNRQGGFGGGQQAFGGGGSRGFNRAQRSFGGGQRGFRGGRRR